MRKIFILSTAVALVAALASADLLAQRPGNQGRGQRPGVDAGDQGPRRGGPGGPGQLRGGRAGAGPGFVMRGLDLTEEQRTKVQEIVRASRDTTGPIADQLRLAQNNLRRAVFADEQDADAVAEISAQVAELRQQLADNRISTSASIAEVLTPEQREKVRVGRGATGMERGPGRGPGRGQGRGPARG